MKFLFCFLLVALPAYSYGLKCFRCSHMRPAVPPAFPEDAECREANNKYLIDCDTVPENPAKVPPHLQKYVKSSQNITADNAKQVVWQCLDSIFSVDGFESISRACIVGMEVGCVDEEQEGGKARICVCATEGCNNNKITGGANAMTSFTILTFICLTVALFKYN